jgi:hypothetical protein
MVDATAPDSARPVGFVLLLLPPLEIAGVLFYFGLLARSLLPGNLMVFRRPRTQRRHVLREVSRHGSPASPLAAVIEEADIAGDADSMMRGDTGPQVHDDVL